MQGGAEGCRAKLRGAGGSALGAPPLSAPGEAGSLITLKRTPSNSGSSILFEASPPELEGSQL